MRPLWLLELGLGLGLGLRSGLGLGLGLGCLVCRGEALVGIGAGEWMRKLKPKSNPNSSWLLHASSSTTPVADEVSSFISRNIIGYVLVGW